jgi:two-component sensor histidine kinase/CheY-like chemotaxis protein
MTDTVIHVLYVDDDQALVRLVQRTLGRSGFTVEHAASPEEALARIAGNMVDVVALDHYLATGTGLDLLSQLASAANSPPVVYVTGSTDMSVAVAALKAGAADFVPKTVGEDFLVLLGSALQQAVDKARLRAQKEAAEEEVRAARDRAEVLLSEVNHRVANSLALVASFVSLQKNAIVDQVAKDALDETQARIYAIASVHQCLYNSGDVRRVALDEYLRALLQHLETSMRGQGLGSALRYEIAPLHLHIDATINLGIVVTEWVTNAFKYAYPDRSGDIRVFLRQLADDEIELAVEDDGAGRDDGPAKGTGLGTRIVKAVAASMGAEIEYKQRHPGTLARLILTVRSND